MVTNYNLTINDDTELSFSIENDDSLSFEFQSNASADIYAGEYEVTPSASTQTLLTSEKLMSANVVINPIPSNYGLITYDGSKLTIT